MVASINFANPQLQTIDGVFINIYLPPNDSDTILTFSYDNDYLTHKFLYYFISNGSIYLSFDFFELCSTHNSIEGITDYNLEIVPFYSTKGYAPFDYTIIKNIYKIPNLFILHIHKDYSIYYELEEPKRNDKKSNETIIYENVACLCKPDVKNVILFSGGYDSTMIAQIFQKNHQSCDVELATAIMDGVDFIPAQLDREYSQLLANKFKFKYVRCKYHLSDITKDELAYIAYIQPNTSHFSLSFKTINDYYKGQTVNFISGQQADSVLNYGCTGFLRYRNKKLQGVGEVLRRIIWNSPSWVARMVFMLLNHNEQSKYAQLSLVAGGYGKLPLIIEHDLFDSTKQLFDAFCKKTDIRKISNSNLIFYALTFLGGGDASGVANLVNSTGPVLPFDNKELIWHFIKKRNSLHYMFTPKLPIMRILKMNKEVWRILNNKPNIPNLSFTEMFDKISINLNLKNDYLSFLLDLGLSIDDVPFGFYTYQMLLCWKKIKDEQQNQ